MATPPNEGLSSIGRRLLDAARAGPLANQATVKVSKRYQVAVPSLVRRQLGIRSGDQLLVEVQDGMIILIPRPKDYAQAPTGLHREVSHGIDAAGYLQKEPGAWETSWES